MLVDQPDNGTLAINQRLETLTSAQQRARAAIVARNWSLAEAELVPLLRWRQQGEPQRLFAQIAIGRQLDLALHNQHLEAATALVDAFPTHGMPAAVTTWYQQDIAVRHAEETVQHALAARQFAMATAELNRIGRHYPDHDRLPALATTVAEQRLLYVLDQALMANNRAAADEALAALGDRFGTTTAIYKEAEHRYASASFATRPAARCRAIARSLQTPGLSADELAQRLLAADRALAPLVQPGKRLEERPKSG